MGFNDSWDEDYEERGVDMSEMEKELYDRMKISMSDYIEELTSLMRSYKKIKEDHSNLIEKYYKLSERMDVLESEVVEETRDVEELVDAYLDDEIKTRSELRKRISKVRSNKDSLIAAREEFQYALENYDSVLESAVREREGLLN